MSFKDKLDRLGAPVGSALGGAPSVPGRSDVLGDLRRKMAEILAEPVAPPRPPANPSGGLLPFEREPTAAGMLHRRRLSLPRSHHVGRVPVDAAHAAQAELLALLALDTQLGG